MQFACLSGAKPIWSQPPGGRGHSMFSWGPFHFSAFLFFLGVSQRLPMKPEPLPSPLKVSVLYRDMG